MKMFNERSLTSISRHFTGAGCINPPKEELRTLLKEAGYVRIKIKGNYMLEFKRYHDWFIEVFEGRFYWINKRTREEAVKLNPELYTYVIRGSGRKVILQGNTRGIIKKEDLVFITEDYEFYI